MSTDKLIKELTNDLKPVKPIGSIFRRLLICIIFTVLLIRGAAYYIGEPGQPLSEMLTAEFSIEIGLLFISGILAIAAALKLSIPDTKIRPLTLALLLLPTIIVIGMHIYGYLRLSGVTLIDEMHNHDRFLKEIFDLLLMITIPTAMLFYVVGKAAPTFKLWTGYSIVLATACFAAIALRMFCGIDHGAHLILYHYLPVLGVSLIGIFIGWFCLRW